jgi:hypothetical protein
MSNGFEFALRAHVFCKIPHHARFTHGAEFRVGVLSLSEFRTAKPNSELITH